MGQSIAKNSSMRSKKSTIKKIPIKPLAVNKYIFINCASTYRFNNVIRLLLLKIQLAFSVGITEFKAGLKKSRSRRLARVCLK